MKLRHIYLILIAICLTFNTKAETITRKQASGIAQSFFNAAHRQVMGAPKLEYTGRDLTTHRLFSPFYIFNHPAGGFIAISAENKTFPILGYSLTESFDAKHIPQALYALLKQYARHAEMIRYDSRIPNQAIDEWTSINQTIASTLQSRTEATDLLHPWHETAEEIAEAPYRADIDALASEIYTPQQWEDMLNASLQADGNVAIGIADGSPSAIIPIAITGRKGAFYKLNAPGALEGYWRIFSTEYLSDAQLALFTPTPELATEEAPYEPFLLTSEFYEEQQQQHRNAFAAIDEIINPTEPTLEWLGTGHFVVNIPKGAAISRIYSITGALMQEQYYRDTDRAFLDISNAPNGVYFALVIAADGSPYSFKLYR